MARVALTGGSYTARSVVAAAQRCLNLYPEPSPTTARGASIIGEPSTVAHYPTPGIVILGTLPQGNIRGIKQATTGAIYAVAGSGVYLVDPTAWTGTLLGSITAGRHTPVSMQDNGLTLVIVDGSTNGWTVDLASHAFNPISSAAFFGADHVDFLDTFFIFNKPGTPQFYWSLSESADFDPLALDFANKESFSDLLVTLAVAKREIWLLGERTTEIWADVGQPGGIADSQFALVSGTFVDHGCRAKYSVASYDNAVYWLTYDRAGQGIVMLGSNYETKKISTFAIEAELTKYPRIDDAIGFVYSLGGHVFYVLTFPTADHTWVYDPATGQWHEWLWIDTNGAEHRHRLNCCYAINGMVVGGDWENGNLYRVDPHAYTDAGQPIKRQRSFPHLINEMDRVFYRQFIADIESGNPAGPPVGTVQTLVSCSFTAPDGTLLSTYHNTADTNAAWTLLGGVDVPIEGDRLLGALGSGQSTYASPSLAVSSADYTLQFRAIPTAYDSVGTVQVFAIARGGYSAIVEGNGTQYLLLLSVLGTSTTVTVAMGTIPSGYYVVTMTLQGALIKVSAQRSSDGLWLQPGGSWASSAVPAITLSDGTFSLPAEIEIGGFW